MPTYKAPQNINNRDTALLSIFLAGSIEMDKAVDWQSECERALDASYNIFNPRRESWDSSWKQEASNPQFNEQVNWELNALEQADVVIMFFAANTKSPISLLEFGLYAQSRKMLVVCENGFWRKGNVEVVCQRYGVSKYENLSDLLKEFTEDRPEKKTAVLLGGAGNNRRSKEYLETVELGGLLAKANYKVKNGGYGGMMEAVSKGASENGGEVIGVTCREVGSEKGNDYLTETIITDRLFKRLELLINDSDLFVFQKGGIGTLSEAFLVLDIIRKMEVKPKIYFIGKVWEQALEGLLENLIPEREKNLFNIVEDIKEIEL